MKTTAHLSAIAASACMLAASASTVHAQLAPELNFSKITPGFHDATSLQPSTCGMGMALTIQNGDLTGPMVLISNYVDGFCEIAIDANPRYYTLTGSSAGCGSIKWTGVNESMLGGTSITITDHRTRFCEDYRPYIMMIEETSQDGSQSTQLYVKPAQERHTAE